MLRRAITRSSCRSLRSSSLFTMFQSSEGTQECSGGRRGILFCETRAQPLLFRSTSVSVPQHQWWGQAILVKAAVSCCFNFVCSFECNSFHVV